MVMECVHNSEMDLTRVYLSRNIGLNNHRLSEVIIHVKILRPVFSECNIVHNFSYQIPSVEQ